MFFRQYASVLTHLISCLAERVQSIPVWRANACYRTEEFMAIAYCPSWGVIEQQDAPDHYLFLLLGDTMNKDQVKGRIEETKGKVKEVAGKVTGNKDLEVKGKMQNVGGKIRAEAGDIKNDIKKFTHNL